MSRSLLLTKTGLLTLQQRSTLSTIGENVTLNATLSSGRPTFQETIRSLLEAKAESALAAMPAGLFDTQFGEVTLGVKPLARTLSLRADSGFGRVTLTAKASAGKPVFTAALVPPAGFRPSQVHRRHRHRALAGGLASREGPAKGTSSRTLSLRSSHKFPV